MVQFPVLIYIKPVYANVWIKNECANDSAANLMIVLSIGVYNIYVFFLLIINLTFIQYINKKKFKYIIIFFLIQFVNIFMWNGIMYYFYFLYYSYVQRTCLNFLSILCDKLHHNLVTLFAVVPQQKKNKKPYIYKHNIHFMRIFLVENLYEANYTNQSILNNQNSILMIGIVGCMNKNTILRYLCEY